MTKNQGPGEARNLGIKTAYKQNIPYLVFLDADDIFSTYNAIAVLYYSIKQNNCDRVEACFAEEGTDNNDSKIYQLVRKMH